MLFYELRTIGKSIFFTMEFCGIFSILGSGLIPGGIENDKVRQAVFFTPLYPFGNDPDGGYIKE